MSNYVQLTNFADKDALPAGNAAKIIRGSEFQTEFQNIQEAVNSKADLAGPTFTGIPAAPTASAGNNTTQVATTAFVSTAVVNERTAVATLTNKTLTDPDVTTQSAGNNTTKAASTAFVTAALAATIAVIYPVGSLYVSTLDTNPATLLGFGTWEAFGAGKVLVGQDVADTSFDTLEDTGGSKDSVVVSHTHSVSSTGTTDSAGAHTHSITDPGHTHTFPVTNMNQLVSGSIASTAPGPAATNTTNSATTGITVDSSGAHTHTVSTTGTAASEGVSGVGANLQPYVVVKMWKRTA